jgi:hypothetical protein
MQAIQAKSNYNPHVVRRCVRVQAAVPGAVVFVSKSMTQADDLDRYHPVIDTENGACRCDCAHFQYRLKVANVWTPGTQCKHLQRAVANMARRGELPAQPVALDYSDGDISDIFD